MWDWKIWSLPIAWLGVITWILFNEQIVSSTLKVFEQKPTESNGMLRAVIFVEIMEIGREESETLEQFEVSG